MIVFIFEVTYPTWFNEAMGYEAKKVRCGKQRTVRGLRKLSEGLSHGSDPRV